MKSKDLTPGLVVAVATPSQRRLFEADRRTVAHTIGSYLVTKEDRELVPLVRVWMPWAEFEKRRDERKALIPQGWEEREAERIALVQNSLEAFGVEPTAVTAGGATFGPALVERLAAERGKARFRLRLDLEGGEDMGDTVALVRVEDLRAILGEEN